MKNIILTLSILFSFITEAISLELSTKYGKITQDELTMTSYDKDTTANAIVLYKKGDVRYNFLANGFSVEYLYETKIKVLNTEGTEYANVVIPYYEDSKNKSSKETITKIEAIAYNLENGKIVKSKMSKDYIFDEIVSSKWKQIKFSIPNVKAGTVIEYRYKLLSDFYHSLSDWNIQQSIPVIYANCEILIPEYFQFSLETKGYEPIKVEDTSEGQTFHIDIGKGQSEPVQSNSRKLVFTSNHVPALKDESNVWCKNDYRSHVSFELHGTKFPYSIYKPYSQTWEDINKMLKESSGFGNNLSIKNPHKEDMQAMGLDKMNNNEKISTLFRFLRNKISWDETYALISDEVKKAAKTGIGNNADFNFIFISMLKDAGIQAYPILISRRPEGRLPYAYPSINKVNTFIVGIANTDTTMVYADGSIVYGDINILPPSLMVDRARLYNDTGNGKWIDLSNLGSNRINMVISATINEEGILKGKRQTSYEGEFASSYKSSYYQSKDSVTFIEDIQMEEEITIINFELSHMGKISPKCTETIEFTKSITLTDDHIYMNPMIFPPMTENTFTNEERKLPVEFSFPYSLRLVSVINIPEGYEVEEMPQPIKFSTEDGKSISCTYIINRNANQIILNYNVLFKRIIFTNNEYPALKKFWETMVDRNNQQIVLRKKDL